MSEGTAVVIDVFVDSFSGGAVLRFLFVIFYSPIQFCGGERIVCLSGNTVFVDF